MTADQHPEQSPIDQPDGTGTEAVPPPPTGDIDEIEADIAATRDRLADAVDALAAKTDVKAQAQAKATDAKEQVQAKAADARDQVRDTADKITSAASDQAARAQHAAQELPSWVPVAAVSGVVGLIVLIIVRAVRRRRR